ncbi:hypothetical protein VTO58DRAFT_108637 [Aureobasidium pullulans]
MTEAELVPVDWVRGCLEYATSSVRSPDEFWILLAFLKLFISFFPTTTHTNHHQQDNQQLQTLAFKEKSQTCIDVHSPSAPTFCADTSFPHCA